MGSQHPRSAPATMPGWLQDRPPPQHRAPCLAGMMQSCPRRRVHGGAKHCRVPRWRSKLQEQHDPGRTEQAEAASAPPAVRLGDGTARAGRQHGDHSSINRQSHAPSLVLAMEAMNGAGKLCKASGGEQAWSRESAGRALSQPGAACPQQAQGVSPGRCSGGLQGPVPPLAESTLSVHPITS